MRKLFAVVSLFVMSMNMPVSSAIYQCSPCPAGKYSTSVNSTNCLSCPAGTYSEMGASSCSQCPSGYYCPGGTNKIACPAGSKCTRTRYYEDPNLRRKCYGLHLISAECRKGYILKGATSPTKCSDGTYQPYSGTSSCLDCNTTVENCDFKYRTCKTTTNCAQYIGCASGCSAALLLVGVCLAACPKCEECEDKTREGHKFVYREVNSDKTSCSMTKESDCMDGKFSQ